MCKLCPFDKQGYNDFFNYLQNLLVVYINSVPKLYLNKKNDCIAFSEFFLLLFCYFYFTNTRNESVNQMNQNAP